MISEYVNYLQNIKGYSPYTAVAYSKDLKQFVAWAKENISDARWSMITRADIDRYITEEAQRGLKPATTNRRLSAISSLYDYLKREGKEVTNPCRLESRRKVAETLPNTIAKEELREAYKHSFGMVKTILGLLITTGCRIQELLDLQWEDINFNDCSLRLNGKGSKQRVAYTTAEVLSDLKNVRDHLPVKGQMFFIDQRQARYIVWQALEPYCKAPQLSPHAIRHSFATNLASNQVNVTTIASILGHKQIATTQKYIDMTQADTRQAVVNNCLLSA